MVVASLLSLLDFMLTREEASWKKQKRLKKDFSPQRLHVGHPGPVIASSFLPLKRFTRPTPFRNADFSAGLKVMCSQAAYLVIYF